MTYVVYVLRGSDSRLYKGMTNNLERRLSEHKRGHTFATRTMKELEVVYKEEYDSVLDARRRELFLKTASGRKFIKRILETRPNG